MGDFPGQYGPQYSQEYLQKLANQQQNSLNEAYLQNSLFESKKKPADIHIVGRCYDGITGELKK